MRCYVLLGTLVLLLGAQYGEAYYSSVDEAELKTATAETQQENEARIGNICQKIAQGSSAGLDLSEDAVVPQLSECCSLRGMDRTECFTSVRQNLDGHYHGKLGEELATILKDPQVAAWKQLVEKKGNRQVIVGPVKSPNPLYAALFMPPRGDDTEGVDLVCRILKQSMDEYMCGSAVDWKQREDVCSLPESRAHYLVEQRKKGLATCCQATGQDKVDCFESLRPTMTDQICDFEPLTLRHKIDIPNPCCEVAGQDRVQCIDKVRYGFSGQAGRFSLDDYASVAILMSFNEVHVSVPRNQSQAQQFCSWLGNKEFIPYAESEELALLRLDPEQMWGSLFRKEARCCLHTGTKLLTCLNEVKDIRNDEMCSEKGKTLYGMKILYWLAWLKSLVTGPSPSMEIFADDQNFPNHPCCGTTGPDRHSCLAQLWRPFNATADTSDFSSALSDYIQMTLKQGAKMHPKIVKYDVEAPDGAFVIYPKEEL